MGGGRQVEQRGDIVGVERSGLYKVLRRLVGLPEPRLDDPGQVFGQRQCRAQNRDRARAGQRRFVSASSELQQPYQNAIAHRIDGFQEIVDFNPGGTISARRQSAQRKSSSKRSRTGRSYERGLEYVGGLDETSGAQEQYAEKLG